MGETINLVIFVGIAGVFHVVGHKVQHKTIKSHHVAIAVATVTHPAVWEGGREFITHCVINYSHILVH